MSVTAKLFMDGCSQAVCLPEEFRFEGTEVRISKVGDKVILEPLARTQAEIAAVWAKIDALRSGEDLFHGDGFDDLRSADLLNEHASPVANRAK
jgi:antitoxin VapB